MVVEPISETLDALALEQQPWNWLTAFGSVPGANLNTPRHSELRDACNRRPLLGTICRCRVCDAR
jgi:hypothetical protein